MNIYNSSPFDRQAVQQKIVENNYNHIDIFSLDSVVIQHERRPLEQLTDQDIKANLFIQIQAMCSKEILEIEKCSKL